MSTTRRRSEAEAAISALRVHALQAKETAENSPVPFSWLCVFRPHESAPPGTGSNQVDGINDIARIAAAYSPLHRLPIQRDGNTVDLQ
jgi:hypothetical protein